jgi:hypothetical protein
VPARDPAALAAAILRLRGDDAERRRLIAAGRERVERLFDIRRMVADYEALYEGRFDGVRAWHRERALTSSGTHLYAARGPK